MQYAFKEAVSIAADLATSGGDFVGVAIDHARQWALDGGTAFATDYWNQFKTKMQGISAQFTGSKFVQGLAEARGTLSRFYFSFFSRHLTQKNFCL